MGVVNDGQGDVSLLSGHDDPARRGNLIPLSLLTPFHRAHSQPSQTFVRLSLPHPSQFGPRPVQVDGMIPLIRKRLFRAHPF